MNKDVELAIESMMGFDHVPHHSKIKDIRLKCILVGDKEIHHKGKQIKAYVEEISERSHIIEIIGGERFGVFGGWYEII